jgi:hypothetical protein
MIEKIVYKHIIKSNLTSLYSCHTPDKIFAITNNFIMGLIRTIQYSLYSKKYRSNVATRAYAHVLIVNPIKYSLQILTHFKFSLLYFKNLWCPFINSLFYFMFCRTCIWKIVTIKMRNITLTSSILIITWMTILHPLLCFLWNKFLQENLKRTFIGYWL